MHFASNHEHFVTLFDSNFLPMGMCLHTSLMQHGQPFHLWILCIDELVEHQLRKLALPNVSLIALQEVETEALLSVKSSRTRGEYCWTLTPFTPQIVFDRDKTVDRVTYLDADLFFFDSPQILLREFENSRKHVLITEHAYAPEYCRTETSGRFCVQFMTFRRTPDGIKVMQWWQNRCLEWCYDRVENGKFGDQKYLDLWPTLFTDDVHILTQVNKTLAPWNVRHFAKKQDGNIAPVFYHFHGLRLIAKNKLRFYTGYRVGKYGFIFYKEYLSAINKNLKTLVAQDIAIPTLPLKKSLLSQFTDLRLRIFGLLKFAQIGTSPTT